MNQTFWVFETVLSPAQTLLVNWTMLCTRLPPNLRVLSRASVAAATVMTALCVGKASLMSPVVLLKSQQRAAKQRKCEKPTQHHCSANTVPTPTQPRATVLVTTATTTTCAQWVTPTQPHTSACVCGCLETAGAMAALRKTDRKCTRP